MEEQDLIAGAQQAMGDLKRAVKGVQKLNKEAGRLRAANAAMGLLGDLNRLHADMTEALYTHYPESFADGIVTLGGGDR